MKGWRLVYCNELFQLENKETEVRIPIEKPYALFLLIIEQCKDIDIGAKVLVNANIVLQNRAQEIKDKTQAELGFAFDSIMNGTWECEISLKDAVMLKCRKIERMDYMFPRSGMIMLTPFCPRNCSYCYWRDEKQNFEDLTLLNFEEWKDVLDECRENGVHTVILMGGEPMAHPDCIRIINYIGEIGMNCMITTKHIFTEEEINEFSRKAVEKLEICESLDTLQEEKSMYIYGETNAVADLRDSIQRLIQKGIKVTVQPLIMRQTLEEYPEIIEKFFSMGVEHIALNFCKDIKNNSCEITNEEKAKIFSILQKYAGRVDFIRSSSGREFRCLNGNQAFDIIWNGNVVRCDHYPDSNANVMGNIKKNTLTEIWNRRIQTIPYCVTAKRENHVK